MSMKEYREAFSGIQPSGELHDSLVEAILEEEKQMKRKHIRPGILAVCAVLMILCLSVTAAAAGFNMNEVFHNFFRREAAPGEAGTASESIPLSGEDAFLLSAGNVIHQETAGNGLKLTLRGTVGDGNALYAALDVETEDGSPFSEEQEGSVQSYRFSEVMLEGDGVAKDGLQRRYCGMERIDDGSIPGKATFLLSEIFDEDLKGKNIKMTLRNLMAESNEVIDMGMDQTLWELMQQFEPLKVREAEGSGGVVMDFCATGEDAEGNVSHHESFMVEKTDRRVAFSSAYPEARISNLGIWRGQYEDNLIVNLELGGELDWDLVSEQKQLIVVDRRTGQQIGGDSGAAAIGNGAEETYFPGMENQADIIGDDYISCRYCFSGIGEDQTKHAVFALGGDGSYDELFGGEWILNFTVDYEDTMKTWKLAEKAEAGGIAVTQVQISPVSAVVEFDTLSDEEIDFEEISLKLKDGSRIESAAMHWENNPEEAENCRILWKSVADLEDVEGITINGVEIPLR